MFRDFYHSFYYAVLIAAAIIGLLYVKKVDKSFRLLCLLLVLTLISELIARNFSFHRKPNGIVYIIFTPIEYFMYVMIYISFFNEKIWTKVLLISSLLLLGAEVLNTLLLQHIDETPTNIMNIESVLLVILSLKLFINIREEPVYDDVLKEGVFWFNSAVLVYYAFDILIWGFHSIVYHSPNPPTIIYNILLLFSGALYIAYAASVLLNYIYKNKITPGNAPTTANKLQ